MTEKQTSKKQADKRSGAKAHGYNQGEVSDYLEMHYFDNKQAC